MRVFQMEKAAAETTPNQRVMNMTLNFAVVKKGKNSEAPKKLRIRPPTNSEIPVARGIGNPDANERIVIAANAPLSEADKNKIAPSTGLPSPISGAKTAIPTPIKLAPIAIQLNLSGQDVLKKIGDRINHHILPKPIKMLPKTPLDSAIAL